MSVSSPSSVGCRSARAVRRRLGHDVRSVAMAHRHAEVYRWAMIQFIAANTSETGAIATEIHQSEMP